MTQTDGHIEARVCVWIAETIAIITITAVWLLLADVQYKIQFYELFDKCLIPPVAILSKVVLQSSTWRAFILFFLIVITVGLAVRFSHIQLLKPHSTCAAIWAKSNVSFTVCRRKSSDYCRNEGAIKMFSSKSHPHDLPITRMCVFTLGAHKRAVL